MHPNESTPSEPDSGHDAKFSALMKKCRYSEGITISDVGPCRELVYESHLELDKGLNFKESVGFERRMVPFFYCSTVVVDVPLASDVRFFEEVRFKPKWMAKYFAETIYAYPREGKRRYVTTLIYDPESKDRRYVAGLRIYAPVNCIDLGRIEDCGLDFNWADGEIITKSNDEGDVQHYSNGSGTFENGERLGPEILPECPNELDRHRLKGLDENSNVFNATKDISVG